MTPAEWIAAGVGIIMALLAIGGVIWAAARMATELKGVKDAINGPMQDRLGVMDGKIDSTVKLARATHDAVLLLPCDLREKQLEGCEKEIEIIKERERRKLQAAEDSSR